MRNLENQLTFQENTTNNKMFCEALLGRNVLTGGKKWLKEVQHVSSNSFQKIRISTGKVKLNLMMSY